MAKSFECLGYISWHRKMDPSVFVVLFQSDAQISRPFVVNGDLIMLIEAVQQVFLILFSCIFHSKIVYT